ncbi:hypothetical protein PMAYCL1PPCAC_26243, partial [Pristionchus mayeri]
SPFHYNLTLRGPKLRHSKTDRLRDYGNSDGIESEVEEEHQLHDAIVKFLDRMGIVSDYVSNDVGDLRCFTIRAVSRIYTPKERTGRIS